MLLLGLGRPGLAVDDEEVFCCWPKSGVGKCNTDVVISDLEVDEPDEFFAKLLLLKKGRAERER